MIFREHAKRLEKLFKSPIDRSQSDSVGIIVTGLASVVGKVKEIAQLDWSIVKHQCRGVFGWNYLVEVSFFLNNVICIFLFFPAAQKSWTPRSAENLCCGRSRFEKQR